MVVRWAVRHRCRSARFSCCCKLGIGGLHHHVSKWACCAQADFCIAICNSSSRLVSTVDKAAHTKRALFQLNFQCDSIKRWRCPEVVRFQRGAKDCRPCCVRKRALSAAAVKCLFGNTCSFAARQSLGHRQSDWQDNLRVKGEAFGHHLAGPSNCPASCATQAVAIGRMRVLDAGRLHMEAVHEGATGHRCLMPRLSTEALTAHAVARKAQAEHAKRFYGALVRTLRRPAYEADGEQSTLTSKSLQHLRPQCSTHARRCHARLHFTAGACCSSSSIKCT